MTCHHDEYGFGEVASKAAVIVDVMICFYPTGRAFMLFFFLQTDLKLYFFVDRFPCLKVEDSHQIVECLL